MTTRHGARLLEPYARAAAATLVLLAPVACAAAERTSAEPDLAPSAPGAATRPARAWPTGSGATTTDTSTPTPVARDSTGPDALRDLVDGVLADYADALTAVAAAPDAASRPGTATRAVWDRTVVPGSSFSQDMLTELRRTEREERLIVVPPAHGPSYRHHPLEVGPPRDGSVSFTWCGWSPGIGLDADTRVVVDDGVAHAHGTGQLRLHGDRWMLETLDEMDLSVRPPGSGDPCLAELALAEQER